MPLPLNIIEWFYARGITAPVLAEHNIDWNGTHIVIPIRDENGAVIFNKYRRDPFGPTDQPKYKYQAGSTAHLFNAHKIKERHSIIICEGEMDAMRLEAAGYIAVTSTGGAGTFKEEWVPLFAGKEVFICFDNDEAGLHGGVKSAIKLLTKFPGAKLVIVPRAEGVKDITDYLKIGGSFPILLENAQEFPILSEPLPEFDTIKSREDQIKKYRGSINEMMFAIRKAKNNTRPYFHLEEIMRLLMVAIDNLERDIRKVRRDRKPAPPTENPNHINDDDIARAKEVPIEELFSGPLRKLGKRATGNCPFHNEKTGSFTIYLDQNKWYCYGCSAGVDAIDFVMKRDSVDFLTAVRTLTNKKL